MSVKSNFEGEEYYEKFADQLLTYKNKRKTLITIIKKAYENVDIKIPRLAEKESQLVDIDPFTVMGLFNRQMKNDTRDKLFFSLSKEIGLNFKVTHFDYEGIPILNPMSANYYGFNPEKQKNVINSIWNLFEHILNNNCIKSEKDKSRFIKLFNEVTALKGNRFPKVTMAMFYVRPKKFLALDGRNFGYLFEGSKSIFNAFEGLPSWKNGSHFNINEYIDMLEMFNDYFKKKDANVNSFCELSYLAYVESEKENKRKADGEKATKYGIYAPGENARLGDKFYSDNVMGIGGDEIGDLKLFDKRNKLDKRYREIYQQKGSGKNNTLCLGQFANEMKPGDIIYVKKGLDSIVGRGVVKSEYMFDDSRGEYKHTRKVNWTHKGNGLHSRHQIVMKTLTDVTKYKEYVPYLESLFGKNPESNITFNKYAKENFLNEVFIDPERYDELAALLKNKKNVILQGPPGVGKTFIAKRLAWSLLGEKRASNIETIQFHQSYSYEDFIEGYRPRKEGGFDLESGIFKEFCVKAKNDRDNDYFFIIDEINRGNMSKIFGELFMLIESDKRNESLKLLYSKEDFVIPDNVYIIGTMNTADRSLALLDYALRRRFAFFDIKPAFDSKGFAESTKDVKDKSFNDVIKVIKELNDTIKDDPSLNEGFCIGHSYFCGENIKKQDACKSIINYEIVQLLKEYWFDEPDNVREGKQKLNNAIK